MRSSEIENKLRDYQAKAINLLRKAFLQGHRKIMLFMATGAGKSFLFVYLCISMLEKNKKVCLVMRRRALVFQASNIFKKFGIDHSIMIGNTKGFDRDKNFQICSIDTVLRRDYSFLENFDSVIYDEGHDTTSQNYQDFMNFFDEKTIHIALTASPFLNAGKAHSFWDVCVKPIEMRELRDQGYLVDCALFVPNEINLDDVKITKGDYQNKQLGEKMGKLEIVGDIVESYKKYGNNKPAICFAVNKAHSIILCEEFNAQGIRAVHADESTKQKERDKILEQFKRGEIDVLCNVNIFSTGVDLPIAEVGIMARPTRSEILYIQQVGRMLRPYRVCGRCHRDYDNSPRCPHCGYDKPKYIKERAIIIDSGNNQSRHGHPFDDRLPVMDEKDKKAAQNREKPLSKTCKHCAYVYDPYLKDCPNCHKEMELPENLYKTKKGEIVPYDEYAEISAFFNNLVRSQIVNGFKDNWKFFQLYEKFGEKCMKYREEFGMPIWIPKIIEKQKREKLKDKLITE